MPPPNMHLSGFVPPCIPTLASGAPRSGATSINSAGAGSRSSGSGKLQPHLVEMPPHRNAAMGDAIEGEIEFRWMRTCGVRHDEAGTRRRQVPHCAYDDGIRVITPDHRLLLIGPRGFFRRSVI
jgi:hypothetical protein